MKLRLVRAELFHADGRTNMPTDMTKLTVVFRNFTKAPKTGARDLPVAFCFWISDEGLYNILTVAACSSS